MKQGTMIALVLMVPAMLGYLYYGWLLYQTITSETNQWIKTLFATDTVKSVDLCARTDLTI